MPPPLPSPPSGWRELTLGGRRYRLIPIGQEAVSAPPDDLVTNLLTPRELQIVALVAQGRVNKQIADDLQISEWTVSTHLRRIFAKLGVDTRAAMVSRCLATLCSPGAGQPMP
jgi:DNA-binding CsgD family transcriptional regulator